MLGQDVNDRKRKGLYHHNFEHGSCGIGVIADLKGYKKHSVISDALGMLACMEHRGGTGFDVKSGDGAGILLQIPHDFFAEECLKLNISLPPFEHYGVGMIFFPKDELRQQECENIIAQNLAQLNLPLLGYREVPVDNSDLGLDVIAIEPSIRQLFIGKPTGMSVEDFERKLFIFRKYTEHVAGKTATDFDTDGFNIVSCSCRTLIYKGQLTPKQVPLYFPDLKNASIASAIALVHSRFSTNTFPSWKLAQPLRYIIHNGEINTHKGNINWMRAREVSLNSTVFSREELEMIFPICDPDASDSANLDLVIELLLLSGRSLPHVLMMLIPEAWQNDLHMDPVKRAFYEFHSAIMEPWDGPASICFTDGIQVGATLDRNGLRPLRYCVTDDDILIMASETGVTQLDHAKVKMRGSLQPGKMFVADLKQGRIISDEELKTDLCSRQPYAAWLQNNMVALSALPPLEDYELKQPTSTTLFKRQQIFGFSYEDVNEILRPMAVGGKEPLGSMGADNPLAVLSNHSVHFSCYFKQLFAQVTNPPIDSIRERIMMDLRTYVGGLKNILTESPDHCRRIMISQPVLTNEDLSKLIYLDYNHFQTRRLDIVFPADGKPGTLERTLNRICRYAEDAIDEGYSIILLSDFTTNTDHAPIPSLLAVAAVHHYLIRAGKRDKADIIMEVGDVREVHHFATVLGFGASAINPYMALDTIRQMEHDDVLDGLDVEKAIQNYIKAINGGLLKILSKMGISTLTSYQGAQIFEIIGIQSNVVEKYFTGTISRLEGLSLDDIATETLHKHRKGFLKRGRGGQNVLDSGGEYYWRKDGERHLFNPTTIQLLQESTRDNHYEKYKKFCETVDRQSKEAFTLRGLMEFNSDRPSISLEEVEPAEGIMKRFATGAMSFGSISWEAHTTLAIAMNRIGAKSNSGEGGEDPVRYEKLPNGDDMSSAIKQIASGRFGVDSYYLSQARELQIKMAQGAKPGEGGHLPGHKVNGWIARVRSSTPGVGLISPPPHHDIYSIEDLAQLIYDLKNSNPHARVNVKLVSETGVGTVAAGVCKAKADVVLIAGHDGGTGASPLSSIKHAGLPWEIGLSETHQTLVRNRLRNRIVLQADGQMKTSRDLAVATLLGAEEWGIATAALVVQGCIMMRKCHSNTCPVGIATQRKELRSKFKAGPDWVVNYFNFLAEGLREIMADLGFRTVNEMVGQSQYLKFSNDIDHWKYKHLDLSPILYREKKGEEEGLYHIKDQDHAIENVLDRKLIEAATSALEKGGKVRAAFDVTNTDRSVGTILSHEVTKVYKDRGLPAGTIHIKLKGSVGQSFGAFMCGGIELELEGDTNDYVGKGLCGGVLTIYPDKKATFVAEENVLVGNICFYGATRGIAYIRGLAGERFCVRNSGAEVVVEGIGNHGCEYMTGGKVVILGKTGRNFGAGMSGGVAYVWDKDGTFASRCNREMIELEKVHKVSEIKTLKTMIETHYMKTNSTVAAELLSKWDTMLEKFVKVIPTNYKRMLNYIDRVYEIGEYETKEEVIDAAFDMHVADMGQ